MNGKIEGLNYDHIILYRTDTEKITYVSAASNKYDDLKFISTHCGSYLIRSYPILSVPLCFILPLSPYICVLARVLCLSPLRLLFLPSSVSWSV